MRVSILFPSGINDHINLAFLLLITHNSPLWPPWSSPPLVYLLFSSSSSSHLCMTLVLAEKQLLSVWARPDWSNTGLIPGITFPPRGRKCASVESLESCLLVHTWNTNTGTDVAFWIPFRILTFLTNSYKFFSYKWYLKCGNCFKRIVVRGCFFYRPIQIVPKPHGCPIQ